MIEFDEHLKEMNEIRGRFEVKKDGGTYIPAPKDNNEAYKQLTEFLGATRFSIYKYHFFKDLMFRNTEPIKKALKDEIENLEKFIENAKNSNPIKAARAAREGNDTNEYRYYRLKNDFYPDNELNDVTILADVYGRYFLFYDLLKEKLNEFEQEKQVKVTIPELQPESKKKLKHSEIALIYVYESKTIGINQGVTIAKEYGLNISETTGRQLYDEYIKYRVKENRTNTNENKRTITNMIIRITNILPYLKSDLGRTLANDELSKLKEKKENY